MKQFTKLRLVLTALVIITETALLTACGESSKNGNSNAAANPIPSGTCGAGKLYVAAYGGCFSTNGCPTGQAYVPAAGQCLAGTAGPYNPTPGGAYGTTRVWSGSLNLSGTQAAYREMLKQQFVCGFYPFGNILSADCNAWDDQASVMVEIQGGTLPQPGRVIVIAYMADPWYGYQQKQMSFSGNFAAKNNNTQFELRTTGGIYSPTKTFVATANVNAGSPAQGIQFFTMSMQYGGGQIGVADLMLSW